MPNDYMTNEEYAESISQCPICRSTATFCRSENPWTRACSKCKSTWTEKTRTVVIGYIDLQIGEDYGKVEAVKKAIEAFWESIANSYPALAPPMEDGDISTITEFNEASEKALSDWLFSRGEE